MSVETQKQRTELSWRRTVLSSLGVAVLFARLVVVSAPRLPALLCVAGGALLWVAIFVLARRRVRSIDRPIGRTLPLVVLTIMTYAVTSVVLVLHIG
jgi:hypothetical protein